jgi:hypothetical protein
MMRYFVRTMAACVLIAATAGWLPSPRASQKESPSQILSAAAGRGKALVAALRGYSYYAEVTIQTVSQADTITGKYYRFSQISFDRNGNRQEKVLENNSTLPEDIYIGAEAADNLTRVYQFIITPETFIQYELNFVGREPIDELSTLVFDVKPKNRVPGTNKSHERYLKGRVWIDDRDLCVVKVVGEVLPEQRGHRTPKFETYFQNYDRFWFPAYSSAVDSIRVDGYFNQVVVNVRFTGYKKVNAKG